MSTGNNYTYWFLLLLTAMTLLVFRPLYWGSFTLGGEAADLFLPVFSHIRETLLQGEWPLWNKYQQQGIATFNFPVYWNPIFLIVGAVFSNPALALNALYLTLIVIAGLGFYKFSGLLVEDERTALLGGLCYPMLGFYVVNGQEIGMIAAAAFTPLLVFINHRYQKTGHSQYLILLSLGYYLFVTMTSPGFILMVSSILLFQAWPGGKLSSPYPRIPRAFWFGRYNVKGEMVNIEEENAGIAGVTSRLSDEDSGHFSSQESTKIKRSGYRFCYLTIALTVAGFLVWRILWTRGMSYDITPVAVSTDNSFIRFIYDLFSFILPKTTAVPVSVAGVEGQAYFHYYPGIVILMGAVMGIFIRRKRIDRELVKSVLISLVLAGFGSWIEDQSLQFASMTGEAYSTVLKYVLTTSVLLLGLRGLEKIIQDGPKIKYFFLALSLFLAGAGYYIERSGIAINDPSLLSWLIQLDVWKSALFLLLAAITLWIRGTTFRFWLFAALIIGDLGLTNFLNQDLNLFSDYPISSFAAEIRFPEKMDSSIPIHQPVGRYSDHDFRMGALDRNTGTLTRHIVRDGYWPWVIDSNLPELHPDLSDTQLRYPLFYFSRDTNGLATPTLTNLDDVIHIRAQYDHRWELSILNHFEKFLILNQNFDKNWYAYVDGHRISVVPTQSGMMQIPITPGLHRIAFQYQTNGLQNIFGFLMVVGVLLIFYLIIRKSFPFPGLVVCFPILMIFVLNQGETNPTKNENQVPMPEWADHIMSYENRQPWWFVRGQQITAMDSHSGFRAESLDQEAIYSATLQLHKVALSGKKGLRYRFYLNAPQSVEIGVVLKTYSHEDESYNIDYIRSLDSGGWTIIEGHFPFDDLHGSPIKAEWYVWNHKKQDFLIDDIEIKLIP